jgi:hypothetical protein
MEANMERMLRDQWLMTENIARFEQLLKTESDTCHRKMLEGLLVLEREKLKDILSSRQ